jgi:hypothetical protein
MSQPADSAIPYEKQTDLQTNRTCGAASLSMVYASLAKPVGQSEIWPKISKTNRLGSLSSTTHLMAQDALNRGFSAVAIQARHPLQVLSLCKEKSVRAILNHRLKEDVPTGHFTVLVDIDADRVVLHDPYWGPNRSLPHPMLLELWRPRFLNAEITGDMLIGISAARKEATSCELCKTQIPASVPCPQCAKDVPLQPAILLGCMAASCPARLWNYLCCPFCDHTWTFSLGGGAESAFKAPVGDPWNLGRLGEEMEKFLAGLAAGPAANHPDVPKQVEFLKGSMEKLKLVRSEEVSRRQVRDAQLEQLKLKFALEEQAILKAREENQKPGPPLDGTILGQSLLRDLGFLGEPKPEKKTDSSTAPKATPQVDITEHPLVRDAIRKMKKPV